MSNRPPPDPVLAAGAAPRPVVSPQTTSSAPLTSTAAPAQEKPEASRPQQEQRSREAIEQLVEQVSKRVQVERRSLSFEVNDDAGLTIVSVVDRETREVIRQIPSEELVRLAEFFAQIDEQRNVEDGGLTGVLLREQA